MIESIKMPFKSLAYKGNIVKLVKYVSHETKEMTFQTVNIV